MEYAEVVDSYYEKAEVLGKDNPNAWLLITKVWWPNPHYKGEPVKHPECDTVYHPPKHVNRKPHKH